jgi:RNA polymerase sigma-70 factor (ECF subfamily)
VKGASVLERTDTDKKTSTEGGPDVAEWYDTYHVRLLNYVRTSLRTETDAQDVSQDVYLRLLRVPEDRVIDHPRAYLFRVAANVVNDWRAGQRLFETRAPEALEEIPAHGDSGEDYDRRLQAERVGRAIASLPATYRATLLLKVQHGMTYGEIAGHLGISERMVKRYVVKAYARMREQLSPLDDFTDGKQVTQE